jgi:hypothetical protein
MRCGMCEGVMKTKLFGLAAVALFALGAAHAQSAHDILAASDKVRNPGQPFKLTNTLVEYINGVARDETVLTVYSKQNQTQEFSNLVRYVGPPRDVGKMVLMNGSNMWFYDPASKASVRISPQQRLLGQASDGDVVTANLSLDYSAKLVGEEQVEDADRKTCDCWHLDMAAASEEAVYSRVEYWVEKGTYRPVKGKYYSDSGRLLKIAYYRNYQMQMGAERPTQTVIIDAVDQNLVTTMTNADMQPVDIPDAWFQRDYLPRVQP